MGIVKKILVCSNAYPPNFLGGAEITAHNQVKYLQAMGYECKVFAGTDAKYGSLYNFISDSYDGVEVGRIFMGSHNFDNSRVNFHNKYVDLYFKALVEEFKPDVVHVHNLIGMSLNIINYAITSGAKVVVTLHDHWAYAIDGLGTKPRDTATLLSEKDDILPMSFRTEYFSRAMSRVNMFTSPSQFLANAYLKNGFAKDRLRVIANGVDIRKFSSVKRTMSDRVRFTLIGYMAKHKGIYVLLDAVRKLWELDFVLNIVGFGDELENMKAFVEKYGLEEKVIFKGRVENKLLAQVFDYTDVLIQPSIWPENQPATIVEAMASKSAVIASEIGGIPEMVIDGQDGLLTRPNDADDLALKMKEYIINPQLARSHGLNGYEKVKHLDYPDQVFKISELYKSL